MEETAEKGLGEFYAEGFDLFHKIDSGEFTFNTPEFKDGVQKCIDCFEKCTHLVNAVSMFSRNETVEEIHTEHMKYLLLPYFLGVLNSKNASKDRDESLKIAQIYFRDFISRCEEYGIGEPSGPLQQSSNDGKEQSLVQMALERNAKIERYRKKKDLEEQIKQFKSAMEIDHIDEEIKRNFYLKLVNLSIINSKEEIASIVQELQLLEYRKVARPEEDTSAIRKNSRRPLEAVIITKNDAQKAVFGAGYPSLPQMTVNDFYEQRVREGIFPDAEKVAENNMKRLNPEDPEEKEEREKAEKEMLSENDDPDYLERQRALDEYKDEVRRGDGNRYNRS